MGLDMTTLTNEELRVKIRDYLKLRLENIIVDEVLILCIKSKILTIREDSLFEILKMRYIEQKKWDEIDDEILNPCSKNRERQFLNSIIKLYRSVKKNTDKINFLQIL